MFPFCFVTTAQLIFLPITVTRAEDILTDKPFLDQYVFNQSHKYWFEYTKGHLFSFLRKIRSNTVKHGEKIVTVLSLFLIQAEGFVGLSEKDGGKIGRWRPFHFRVTKYVLLYLAVFRTIWLLFDVQFLRLFYDRDNGCQHNNF